MLRKCIGKRIDRAELFYGDTQANLCVASTILEGVQFDRLGVNGYRISDCAAKHLLETITSHNVDILSLNVHKFETANPVNLLLYLASFVKSIEIFYQPRGSGSKRGRTNFMFGVANANWGRIIVEMFTRKLDMLIIYKSKLSAKCVKLLAEKLPKLGKELYFHASCAKLAQNREFTSNGHLVRVEHTSYHDSLSIIHSSRENER